MRGRCRGAHYSAEIEKAVIEHYRSVRLTDDKQREIIEDVQAAVDEALGHRVANA